VRNSEVHGDASLKKVLAKKVYQKGAQGEVGIDKSGSWIGIQRGAYYGEAEMGR
jgi:hypothetical protein